MFLDIIIRINVCFALKNPMQVGDLGLSKIKQQTMISGGVRGTLPWMAPELLNGSSSLVSEKVKQKASTHVRT